MVCCLITVASGLEIWAGSTESRSKWMRDHVVKCDMERVAAALGYGLNRCYGVGEHLL